MVQGGPAIEWLSTCVARQQDWGDCYNEAKRTLT